MNIYTWCDNIVAYYQQDSRCVMHFLLLYPDILKQFQYYCNIYFSSLNVD